MAPAKKPMPRKETHTVKAGDERFVELFLDMLAAERGAGDTTLAAYRRDLTDFSAHLAASRRSLAGAVTEGMIEGAEVIEVEHGDRDGALGAPGVGNGLSQALLEQQPVRQPGERVVGGEVLKAGMHLLELAGALCRALGQAALVGDGDAGHC